MIAIFKKLVFSGQNSNSTYTIFMKITYFLFYLFYLSLYDYISESINVFCIFSDTKRLVQQHFLTLLLIKDK